MGQSEFLSGKRSPAEKEIISACGVKFAGGGKDMVIKMSRLECNVIKDLLPSYVDQICSEETRGLVEEHTKECRECRELIKIMKDTEIVSGQTNLQEIDYMKKVKKHFANKNLLTFGILGFVLIGVAMIVVSYGDVSAWVYYIIAPALMLTSYIALPAPVGKPLKSKWKVIMSSVSAVLCIYVIVLIAITEISVLSNCYLFGIQPDKIGPFIYNQLIAMIMMQMGIFICAILLSVKATESCMALLNMNIIGSSLALVFSSVLRRMDTVESFIRILNSSVLLILAEGILMAVLMTLFHKKRMMSHK